MIKSSTVLVFLVHCIISLQAQSFLLKGKISKNGFKATDTLKLNPTPKVFVKERFFKNWQFNIPLNEDGSFETKLDLQGEGPGYFFSNIRGLSHLYLAPDKSLSLEVDISEHPFSYSFSGALAPENQYLFNSHYTIRIRNSFENLPEVFDQVNDSSEKAYFAMLDRSKVSSEFYEMESLKIRSTHAESILNYARDYVNREGAQTLSANYFNFLSKIKVKSKADFLYSSNYLWFLDKWIYHRALLRKNAKEQVDDVTIDNAFLLSRSHVHLAPGYVAPSIEDEYKEAMIGLDNTSLMYYLGHFFVYKVPMSSYRDSLIIKQAYQAFVENYPDSKYRDLIEKRYQHKQKIWSLTVLDQGFDFVVEDTLGNQVNFREFLLKHQGSILYFDIWSTSCKPCIAAIPHSNELQLYYSDSSFLAINISIDDNESESIERWKKVIRKHSWKGYHFRCPPGGPFAPIMQLFDAVSQPTHVLITPGGRVLVNAERPGTERIHKELKAIF